MLLAYSFFLAGVNLFWSAWFSLILGDAVSFIGTSLSLEFSWFSPGCMKN